MMNKLGKDCQ